MAGPVRQRILEIIAKQAVMDLSEIVDSATPESLGLDSLGLVETVFAIEEAFDITVPFNAAEADGGGFDISSVGAMILAVEAIIGEKTGQPA